MKLSHFSSHTSNILPEQAEFKLIYLYPSFGLKYFVIYKLISPFNHEFNLWLKVYFKIFKKNF